MKRDSLVGEVIEIWRYPIEGLMGERLEIVSIGPRGPTGDRAFGVWDVAAERFIDILGCPELLLASARTDGDTAVAVLPGDIEAVAGTAAGDAAWSSWLGRAIEIRRRPTDDAGPAVALVRIVSLSSVAALARRHPSGQWDVRRVQPHLVIAVPGFDFAEDEWVGEELRIGRAVLAVEAGLAVSGLSGLAQVGLAADPDIPATIRAAHEGTLGVTARSAEGGDVRLGDVVGAPGR